MDANCSGSSGSSGGKAQDEAAALRREVASLHGALAREQQRAGGLAAKLLLRDTSVEARRAHADKQAAALLRALLVLEASLRKEQSAILHKLQLKDQQIIRQREEIHRLKRELRTHCSNCQQMVGFTSEQTNIETDPEFHSLDSVETQKVFERSSSYHESHLQQPFQKNSRLSKSFQQSKNDVKYGNTSSSEEVFETNDASSQKGTYVKNKQAFVRKDVTRRSRKFSGRRHSSAYLDTVQKTRQNRSQASSSSAEDGPQSEKDSKLFHPEGDEDCDIGEEISKDIERASNRIDELLNSPEKYEDQMQSRLLGRSGRDRTFSAKIDNLHGIRKPASSDEASYRRVLQNGDIANEVGRDCNGNSENPWYNNVSDPEQEECPYGSSGRLGHVTRAVSADNVLSKSSNSKTHKAGNSSAGGAMYSADHLLLESAVSTSNTESTSDKESNQRKNTRNQNNYISNNNVKTTNQHVYEACNNKFDNEQNENWYASASDPDDDPSCEIYKNNPVLECVNQILLQNSLDENSSDTPRVYESPSPKASTKRVQFSTLNSISFDESVGKNGQNYPRDLQRAPQERRSAHKIVKFSLETASEHSYEAPLTAEAFNYEVQSIYSNDYEPIITKSDEELNSKLKSIPIPLPRTINNINRGPGDTGSLKKNTIVKNMAMSLENKMNGNHYVDMDTKYVSLPSALNKRKVPRVPPALPPKPKNLVSKFKLTNPGLPGSGASSLPPNLPLSAAAPNSDPVAPSQRTPDVPGGKSTGGSSKSSVSGEPDYCSISEVNVPVVSSGKRGLTSTEVTVEIHAEKRALPKLATIAKITPNKLHDKDIPMLPQVTEIIIPDEDDLTEPPKIAHETYAGKPPPHTINTGTKKDLRNSIQIGHSVSTILTDIKNRSVSIEDVNKCIMSTDMNRSFANGVSPKQVFPITERSSLRIAEKSRIDLPIFEAVENDCEKFDLSQNFEEFKIDDCEFTNIGAEEYRISSGTSDASSTDSTTDEVNGNVLKESSKLCDALTNRNPAEGPYRIEFTAEDDLNARNLALNAASNNPTKLALKNYTKIMSNKPDLLSNIDSVDTDSVRYSDLESSNSSSSNCGSYNTVKCEPSTFVKEPAAVKSETKNALPFEYFLESSGLSSKSILTPSRPPSSNHKSVQKPRDVKMKSKTPYAVGRVTPLYEKCGTNTAIKYFEPYL